MPQHSALSRFLIGFAAFIIVVAGLKSAQSLVVPLLMAGFIATEVSLFF
ncbi:MAG: hypothetical protein KZQ58_04665 [gamma proteobacterium symbiont of Bathyaustriella thionipta]|nr:hypothetical protein [gamma proteobacterium symbiont of Bathyaustriella thionipta]